MEIIEGKVDIVTKTGAQGKVYRNISIRDIKPNTFIIVTKSKYAVGLEKSAASKTVGKPNYSYYICSIKYQNEECSMLLYEGDHKKYAAAGGIDDRVKITCTIGDKPIKGAYRSQYAFEKV